MVSITLLDSRLKDFKGTLNADVRSLMRLYEAEKKKTGPKPAWLPAILRSACVLLTANLENYIENLVCDSLTHLATNRVVANNYPLRFRYWLFRKDAHMRNIGVDDARQYIELSQRLFSPVRSLELDELRLGNLKEEFANPTPKNVNWLIGLLDQDEYLDRVTIKVEKTDTSASSSVGELAQRRNDIAHGDIAQQPKDSDIYRLTKFCQLLGNRLHKDITRVTTQCLP